MLPNLFKSSITLIIGVIQKNKTPDIYPDLYWQSSKLNLSLIFCFLLLLISSWLSFLTENSSVVGLIQLSSSINDCFMSENIKFKIYQSQF